MARMLALSFVACAHVAAAASGPQMTARAELHPRADPSILGYVSTSGASDLTDLRSCDFPATLTTNGPYAQCCQSGKPCDFFTSCSAGNVVAASTSVFCDQGFCNTAVIVPTAGASNGQSVLGCWATDLGSSAFALVQDIGSATSAPSATRAESGESGSTGTAAESSQSGNQATSSTSASGSAAAGVSKPFAGAVGLVAGLVVVL